MNNNFHDQVRGVGIIAGIIVAIIVFIKVDLPFPGKLIASAGAGFGIYILMALDNGKRGISCAQIIFLVIIIAAVVWVLGLFGYN